MIFPLICISTPITLCDVVDLGILSESLENIALIKLRSIMLNTKKKKKKYYYFIFGLLNALNYIKIITNDRASN